MSEFHLQRDLIKWFKETYPQYEKCIRLSMNGINLGGGAKAARIINQMRSQGMTPGESDLFFAIKTSRFAGLFLELKDEGKSPTDAQNEYLYEMIRNGYFADWCDNIDEAKRMVSNYIGEK